MSVKSFMSSPKASVAGTIIGLVSMTAGTVILCNNTPTIIANLREAKAGSRSRKEMITKASKSSWKKLVPGATMFLGGAGLVIVSLTHDQQIITKQAAGLIASSDTITILKKTLNTVQNAAIEQGGEKVKAAITEATREQVLSNPSVQNEARSGRVVETGLGNLLCISALDGQQMRSSINAINAAFNTANQKLMVENQLSVNEVYSIIGLPLTDAGAFMYFDANDGLIDYDIISAVDDRYGEVVCTISFNMGKVHWSL